MKKPVGPTKWTFHRQELYGIGQVELKFPEGSEFLAVARYSGCVQLYYRFPSPNFCKFQPRIIQLVGLDEGVLVSPELRYIGTAVGAGPTLHVYGA